MNAFHYLYKILQAESTLTNPAWYLVFAILFALMPVAVGLLTSYVKISIVLGIIKNALGTQHAPSAMVTLALSLSLTALSMNSVIKETLERTKGIDSELISKSSSNEIFTVLRPLFDPWEKFLRKNSGQKELTALLAASTMTSSAPIQPAITTENADLILLIPSFLLSELKEGFSIAFIVLLPFLAIDLIISNILMGLGMMMVSPVLISLPIKLILFVASDAWLLIAQGLIRSYQV